MSKLYLDDFFDALDHPLVQKAWKFERETKQKGRQKGELGYVSIEILSYLLELEHYSGTWHIPTQSKICEDLKRSKNAVSSGLQALRKHGFLDKTVK